MKIFKVKKPFLNNLVKKGFRIIDIDALNCSIGLLEEIYQILNPLVSKENLLQENLKNINKELNSKLDRFEKISNHELENEEFSIGLDGVRKDFMSKCENG